MQFIYNWSSNLRIKSILTRIYQNTLTSLSEEDKHYANQFINALEDFIVYMIKYKHDLNKIIEALRSIECISFQPSYQEDNRTIRRINYVHPPRVIIQDRKILLSKDIKGSTHLTADEQLRLYLYHGLCHIILQFRNEETRNFSKIYHEVIKDIHNGEVVEQLVDNGWLLLEDAIAEEIAETIVYDYAKKSRPGLSYGGEANDQLIIDGTKILSNYDSFRMFQPILIMFGWTLSNVGSIENPSNYIIRNDIVNRAINENFSESVIAEYLAKNREFELFQLLFLMGKLVNAKYTSFGITIEPGVNVSKEENNQAYEEIFQLAMGLVTLEKSDYDKKLPIPKFPKNDVIRRKILILLKQKPKPTNK